MARSRMFGSDEPPETKDEEAERSPRTTIVGARPPDRAPAMPPVPTGLQRLLRLAGVDGAFRRALVERRADVAQAAGIPLTAAERATLAAAPADMLDRMVAQLPEPPPDRASQLALAAAAALTVLFAPGCGGSTATSTPPAPSTSSFAEPPPPRPTASDMANEGGIAPNLPDRPDHRMQAPGGAAPDVPPPRPDDSVVVMAGAVVAPSASAPPRPSPRLMPAGVRPMPPPPRPPRGDKE